jgi:hypothetical protein
MRAVVITSPRLYPCLAVRSISLGHTSAESFRGLDYKLCPKCLQASQTEVTGTKKVSGCCVPAFFAGETILSWPVALADETALRAPLRRVMRGHAQNRNAGFHRLVGRKQTKLGECPARKVALRLPNLRPAADARQIFEANRTLGSVGPFGQERPEPEVNFLCLIDWTAVRSLWHFSHLDRSPPFPISWCDRNR